ncbi:MAG: coenzyme F420 hydrogenase, partial [Akkermansiaceae bacterium]|nr:coenzyme F420 hydrogenase [Akkermansiaceae bacterium]
MVSSPLGPLPRFGSGFEGVAEAATRACPAYRLDYPQLYHDYYGSEPESWLTGVVVGVRTGFAKDEAIRRSGASGGVTTRVLLYLLESGRVDGVIVARQGVPTPLEARAVIATTPDEIVAAAQSVYVPVSMLEILPRLEAGKRYAMTALPDQSAALRRMALDGFAPARQIEYVLGPYTGTALYPEAIDCFVRSNGVSGNDAVASLNWRAGEWPGHLEIVTESGRVLRSKKVYYNYLIPFFVTQNSLQNMDFVNEFADL